MWAKIPGDWFDYARLYDDQVARVLGQSATFVEVGSWLGRSTAYMAEAIRFETYQKPPIRFFAVDTWLGSGDPWWDDAIAKLGDVAAIWRENMERCGVADYVEAIQLPSVEAAKRFPDCSLDFVFIDADHRFDSVVADIRAWRPKVRGVIAGHDYDERWPGVIQAVQQEFAKFRTWERCWIVD